MANVRLATAANDLLDLLTHGLQGNTHGFQRLRSNTLAFLNQAKKNVLRADVIVIEAPSLLLRQHDDAASSVRKPLEHDSPSFSS